MLIKKTFNNNFTNIYSSQQIYTIYTYIQLHLKSIRHKIQSWNLTFMLTAQHTTDTCHGICVMITSCNASYTYMTVEVVHRTMPSEPIIQSKSSQHRLNKEEMRNYSYSTFK